MRGEEEEKECQSYMTISTSFIFSVEYQPKSERFTNRLGNKNMHQNNIKKATRSLSLVRYSWYTKHDGEGREGEGE